MYIGGKIHTCTQHLTPYIKARSCTHSTPPPHTPPTPRHTLLVPPPPWSQQGLGPGVKIAVLESSSPTNGRLQTRLHRRSHTRPRGPPLLMTFFSGCKLRPDAGEERSHFQPVNTHSLLTAASGESIGRPVPAVGEFGEVQAEAGRSVSPAIDLLIDTRANLPLRLQAKHPPAIINTGPPQTVPR